MKAKSILLTITMLIVSLCVSAQSIQYGYTEEYRGANEKTPLKGVNIIASGASSHILSYWIFTRDWLSKNQTPRVRKIRLNYITNK